MRGNAPFAARKEINEPSKPIGPQSGGRGERPFLAEQQWHVDGEIFGEFFRIGECPWRQPRQLVEQEHRRFRSAVIETENRMRYSSMCEGSLEAFGPIQCRSAFFFRMWRACSQLRGSTAGLQEEQDCCNRAKERTARCFHSCCTPPGIIMCAVQVAGDPAEACQP